MKSWLEPQKEKTMKWLVVGGGSMGKRRIRCLLAHAVKPEQIRVVDTRSDRRDQCADEYNVRGWSTLDDGIAWNPDALIVSVPGIYHMPICLAAVRAGKHFFCEVPLSLSREGADELLSLVDAKGLVAAPGCQLRFDPLYGQYKTWAADPAFGKPAIYIETFGQYLPDWHPHEDYRKFYASHQSMGGCNLDVLAQQMLALTWLLDDTIEEVFCRGSHLSSLEVDGNDCMQIIARTGRDLAITLQYDLIQRAGHHGGRLISEQGTLELNPVEGSCRRYLASSRTWDTYTRPEDWKYETCYIEEIGLFVACIQGKAKWFVPLKAAVDVVAFLEAAQQSAASGQTIRVPQCS